MRKLIFLLALIMPIYLFANTYYMSPTGSDSNPGTIGSPWRTFTKVNATLVAGDILYVRGGTYLSLAGNGADHHFLINGLHGTSTDSISIRSYPGELPTFSCENITPTYSDPYLMFMNDCSYVHIKGFHIYYLKQYAVMGAGISRGFSLSSSNNCTVDRFDIECIGGQGLIIENQSANNYIVDCDSHHNSDYYNSYDAADGFSATGPLTNNINNHWVRCRSFMNSDDGFDTFNTITVNYYDNCLSYYNGFNPFGAGGTQVNPANKTPLDTSVFFSNPAYWVGSGEGFKLGRASQQLFNTITKYLNNCLAFMNRGTGYAANSIDQQSTRMSLINCVAYCNSNDGFSFGAGWQIGFSQIFENDWAWLNNRFISGADYVYDGNNSLGGINNDVWMTTQGNVYGNLKPPISISNADFLSVDQTTLTGARQADGSYPVSNFLKLAPTSDLIDAGINAGLPFCGTAPDVNWAEYCTSTYPTVNIGADQNITLPTNSVSFIPTVTNASSYQWSTYSGSAGTFSNPTSANTTYGNLNTAGVRGVRLCVTNSSGTVCDSALVTVSAGNTPPTCSAGTTPITITLPTNTFALSGTGASTSGNSVSFLWGFTLGSGTIASNTSQNTTATISAAGNYAVSLLVTDVGNGLTCTSSKSITVNPEPVVPTANAGANQTITLPTNSVVLSGSGSGGTINSYLWTLVQGNCVGCNFSAPTSATCNFTGLTAGVYLVRLRVGNTDGNYGYDTTQITVLQAPTAPICSAGLTPVTITLPTNSAGLSATGASTSGNTVSFAWTQISGTAATIVNPNSQNATATSLSAGTSVFRVTVTDNVNMLSCTSDKTIIVNTAPLVPPTVVASPHTQTISLPNSTATLTSIAVASTGSITSILWTQLTGTSATITTPTTANTTITGLVAGTTTFRVLVTQTGGLQAADTVTIITQATTSGNGIKYFQGSIYNNRNVNLGWTFYPQQNPTTKYMIAQMKNTSGVFVDIGARVIPVNGVIDYWSYYDLVGKPKGTYFFRIMQKDANNTYYSNVVSLKKK